MAYATIDDLLVVEPTIQDYGVLDWDAELERSTNEINRVLKVRWFLPYAQSKNHQEVFDPNKIDGSQFTQANIYHSLAYHICPKLTQFTPEDDRFSVMMKYYQGRFEHEMDLILREGVQYDLDGDSTVSEQEAESVVNLRLRR